MSDRSVRWLTVYLVAMALLSFHMVFALWSAEPQVEAGRIPQPDCGGAAGPAFTEVYPARVTAGAAQEIWIAGCGFTDKTQVKINAAAFHPLLVDASHIRVGLAATDFPSPGSAVVTLENDALPFGSRVLSILPAAVLWRPFGSAPVPIGQEARILLLVVFVGALGSTIYAMKSMANYRGDHTLQESWFMYYTVQPVEGAGIAFLFYLVIRAGFITGAGADLKTANLFGICAMAGLAGTFSDMAFRKLREVFETLFKPRDNRGGKAGARITTTALADATAGQAYSASIAASGGTAPLTWSVNPALPAGLTLDAATGAVTGTPAASLSKTAYEFTVTDSAATPVSTHVSLELEVRPGGGGTTAEASREDADGCDVAVTSSTRDDELPPTEGGVA